MGQTIGTSARYSTWAVLRSPMWKGSGFRDQPSGVNKNTGKAPYSGTPVGFNMVYEENLGRLSIAFPFLGRSILGTNWANSMCLGLRAIGVQAANDEEGIPAIFDFYLSHGEGILEYGNEYVLNGYNYGVLASGLTGYDTIRTRDQYRGAVVNVTFTPGPTMTPVTTDVTVTDDLFPDDLSWSVFETNYGVYIGTYTWPVPSGGLTWDQPYWTINSLTMP